MWFSIVIRNISRITITCAVNKSYVQTNKCRGTNLLFVFDMRYMCKVILQCREIACNVTPLVIQCPVSLK